MIPSRAKIRYCAPRLAASPLPVTTAMPSAAVQLTLRPATAADFDSIWEIFHLVLATEDTWFYPASTTREEAAAIWQAKGTRTFVAERDGEIVGACFLRPVYPGLASHVANAGYIVHPAHQGFGIGRALAEHSLIEARRAGFSAMQFNFVVSTNEPAVALWKKLGFEIIATLPAAFRHREHGLVDAFVMRRFL
jgi:L-amino acid N-acyltransferase YncA